MKLKTAQERNHLLFNWSERIHKRHEQKVCVEARQKPKTFCVRKRNKVPAMEKGLRVPGICIDRVLFTLVVPPISEGHHSMGGIIPI